MYYDDDMRTAIMDALVETGYFTFNYLAQLNDQELDELCEEYNIEIGVRL